MQLTPNPYSPNGPGSIRHNLWQIGYDEAGIKDKPATFIEDHEEYIAGRKAGLRDKKLLDQGAWKISLRHAKDRGWCVVVGAGTGWRTGPWFETKDEAAALAYNISKSMREQKVPLTPVATILHTESLMAFIEMEIDTSWDAFNDDPYEQFDPSVLDSIKLNSDRSVDLTYDQATEIVSLIPSWMELIEDCSMEEDLQEAIYFALILQRSGFPFEGLDHIPGYSVTLDEHFFHYTFPDGTGGVSTSYRFASATLHSHFMREYRETHLEVVHA